MTVCASEVVYEAVMVYSLGTVCVGVTVCAPEIVLVLVSVCVSVTVLALGNESTLRTEQVFEVSPALKSLSVFVAV